MTIAARSGGHSRTLAQPSALLSHYHQFATRSPGCRMSVKAAQEAPENCASRDRGSGVVLRLSELMTGPSERGVCRVSRRAYDRQFVAIIQKNDTPAVAAPNSATVML